MINQVNPGVFFYWIKVTGGGTYNITQTITTVGTNVTQKFNFAFRQQRVQRKLRGR